MCLNENAVSFCKGRTFGFAVWTGQHPKLCFYSIQPFLIKILSLDKIVISSMQPTIQIQITYIDLIKYAIFQGKSYFSFLDYIDLEDLLVKVETPSSPRTNRIYLLWIKMWLFKSVLQQFLFIFDFFFNWNSLLL